MIIQIVPIASTSTDVFSTMDPYGISMTLIAMTVVFSALILLYIIFKNLQKIYTLDFKDLFKKKEEATSAPKTEDTSGEVIVAIASAIHLFRNQFHDVEDTVLTIKKVTKNYSPWSSKIYGLRKFPKN